MNNTLDILYNEDQEETYKTNGEESEYPLTREFQENQEDQIDKIYALQDSSTLTDVYNGSHNTS